MWRLKWLGISTPTGICFGFLFGWHERSSRQSCASRAGSTRENDRIAVKVKVLETPNSSGDPGFDIAADEYQGLVDSIMESLTKAVQAEVVEEPAEGGDVIHLQAYHTQEPQAAPANCDYFVGRLRCMHCSTVSRADSSTNCETFLRSSPAGEAFGVGDHLGPVFESARADYYATPHERTGDDLHVLEGWECPVCAGVNWAEIVVVDDRVKSIWSVTLNQATLKRAHLISSESVEIAAELTGRPPWTLLDEDILTILFERL